MDSRQDHTAPLPLPDQARLALFLAAGPWRGALPADRILDICLTEPAAPMPFAALPVDGIVGQDSRALCQIDLAAAVGGLAGRGRYGVTVATSLGPVRLRVDSVGAIPASLPAASPPVSHPLPDAVDDPMIATLLSGLTATADPTARPGLPAAPAAVATLPVLRVAGGGRVIALPAMAVDRVERHDRAWRPRTAATDERAVAIGDDVLPGWSLTAHSAATVAGHARHGDTRDESGGDSAAEPWSVVLRTGDGPAALTVAAIHGLWHVPLTGLYRLNHRVGRSAWYRDPDHGPVELIDPPVLTGGRGSSVIPAVPARSPGPPPSAAAAPIITTPGIAANAAGFRLVFPFTAIRRVYDGIAAADLTPQRTGRALPVFTLNRLLASDGTVPTRGPVLVVQRPGRGPVGILADTVGPAEPAPDWQALPVAPALLAALCDGVRHGGTGWQFRVRPPDGDRPDRLVASRLTAAWAGWLPGGGTEDPASPDP